MAFNIGTGFNLDPYVIKKDSSDRFVIGGFFTSYNGSAKKGLVRLNPNGSIDGGFTSPSHSSYFDVIDLAIQSDGKIVVGGNFVSFNAVNHLTRFNSNGTVDTTFNGGGSRFDYKVEAVELDSSGNIYVGGDFFNYNGVSHNRIVKLNSTGAVAAGWSSGTGFAGGDVKVIKFLSSGNILVGGTFTSYNGTGVNRIALLNSNGVLQSFSGSITGAVDSMVISVDAIQELSSGDIMIGGSFTTVNGTARRCVARLNSDGTLDTGFAVPTGFLGQTNSTFVTDFIVDGTDIYIFGSFTSYNGTTKYSVVRANSDGTNDTGFAYTTQLTKTTEPAYLKTNTGVLYNGYIYTGGLFNAFNGYSQNNYTRIDTSGKGYIPEPASLNCSTTTSSSITMTWGSVGLATQYRLQRLISSVWTDVYVGGSTSFNNTGLSPSTSYQYRVRAENGSSLSDYITQTCSTIADTTTTSTSTTTSSTTSSTTTSTSTTSSSTTSTTAEPAEPCDTPNTFVKFFTTGTTSWTVPANVDKIYVEAVGGGARGNNAVVGNGGLGGKGGSYIKASMPVTAGENLNVTVGRGGIQSSGAQASSVSNQTGETRSVSTGVAAGNSSSGTTTVSGTGVAKLVQFAGGDGGVNTTVRGGGGGGGAGSSQNGGDGFTGAALSTFNAGGGNGGFISGGTGGNVIYGQDGGNGGLYGGGGGGGDRGAGSATNNGGDGGQGYVIISYCDPSKLVEPDCETPNLKFEFLTTGTTSWTVPTGITNTIYITALGGGAGGQKGTSGVRGANGGKGGSLIKARMNVTAGETLTINVGSGGLGQTVTAGAFGQSGGTSSVSASGGRIVSASGGIQDSISGNRTADGYSVVKLSEYVGGNALRNDIGSPLRPVGGGGGAGTTQHGSNGVRQPSTGYGGGGAGGSLSGGTGGDGIFNNVGLNGSIYGAAGGGGGADGGSFNGGNGAQGYVIIECCIQETTTTTTSTSTSTSTTTTTTAEPTTTTTTTAEPTTTTTTTQNPYFINLEYESFNNSVILEWELNQTPSCSGDTEVTVYRSFDGINFIALYQLTGNTVTDTPVNECRDCFRLYYKVVSTCDNLTSNTVNVILGVNIKEFNLGGIQRLFLANRPNDIDYNVVDPSFYNLDFQDNNILTISDFGTGATLTWYELPVAESVNYRQQLNITQQGFVFSETLSVVIPKLNPAKWNTIKDIIGDKYIVVFQTNNNDWCVMGYEIPAEINVYKATTEDSNYSFDITVNNNYNLLKFIDKNYVETNIL